MGLTDTKSLAHWFVFEPLTAGLIEKRERERERVVCVRESESRARARGRELG